MSFVQTLWLLSDLLAVGGWERRAGELAEEFQQIFAAKIWKQARESEEVQLRSQKEKREGEEEGSKRRKGKVGNERRN